MDRRMMNQWLAAQGQKKQVTEASMQRKRLGIKEGVNYGDINFRAPIDPNTGEPYFKDFARTAAFTEPRSPESAANLSRRLGNLYNAAADAGRDFKYKRQERIADMMMAKGVGPEIDDVSPIGDMDVSRREALINRINLGEPVSAGQSTIRDREKADRRQVIASENAREAALAAKRAAANRIGGVRPARPGAVSADTLALMAGVGGAVAGGMAAAAPAALDSMAGLLNPPPNITRQTMEKMTNSDAGLAFDVGPDGELVANQAGMKAVRDRQKKGASFPTYYPQVNENNMMKQWLKAQTQKQLWF